MNEAMVAQTAQNVATLYRQIIRIDARLRAFERVLSESPAFDGLLEKIGNVEREIIAEQEQKIQDAAREIEAERKKPKLTIVGANEIIN